MKKLVYMKKKADVKIIQPGTYNATITAIEEVADYEHDDDLIIFFNVYDGTNVIEHWECLQFNNGSKRREKLRKMVKGLGDLDYSFLIGIDVTLKFDQEYSVARQYRDHVNRKLKIGKKESFDD